MSSYNDCIKFSLDIKDPNLIFEDYFYKIINQTNIKYITANASCPVIIRLYKQRVLCKDCHKWSMAQSNLVDKYCHIANPVKQKSFDKDQTGKKHYKRKGIKQLYSYLIPNYLLFINRI